MNYIHRTIGVALIFATLIQWLGIGAKISHAYWQWYKFHEYSAEGYTTISNSMFAVTFILSTSLIFIGYIYKRNTQDVITKRLLITGSVGLFIGLVILLLLIISPFGTLVDR